MKKNEQACKLGKGRAPPARSSFIRVESVVNVDAARWVDGAYDHFTRWATVA